MVAREPEEKLLLQEAVGASAGRVPLSQLRYDGKSFAEWKAEWQHELKPERRAEAVKAFAAFGANGYGEEAATAILEVMRHLEIAGWEAFHPRYLAEEGAEKLSGNDLIKQAAMAAFAASRTAYRIPPAASIPVLTRELKGGNRNGRLFAMLVLQSMWQEAQPALPALRQTMERDKDPTVRASAYLALAQLDPSFRVSAETVRELLKDADPLATQAVLSQLVPEWTGGSGRGGTVFEETPQPAPGAYGGFGGGYGAAMYGGDYMGGSFPPAGPPRELRPDAQPILEVLIEAVKSEQGYSRRAAIEALGRIGPQGKGVVPALIEAFKQGDAADREAVLQALGRAYQSGPGPGMPGMSDMSGDEMMGGGAMPGMPGMPGQVMMPGGMGTTVPGRDPFAKPEFDWPTVVSKLVQALDPGKPADLWMMGRIYSQYRSSGKEALSILQKATTDEDPEVRRAATEALKAATSEQPGQPRPGQGFF